MLTRAGRGSKTIYHSNKLEIFVPRPGPRLLEFQCVNHTPQMPTGASCSLPTLALQSIRNNRSMSIGAVPSVGPRQQSLVHVKNNVYSPIAKQPKLTSGLALSPEGSVVGWSKVHQHDRSQVWASNIAAQFNQRAEPYPHLSSQTSRQLPRIRSCCRPSSLGQAAESEGRRRCISSAR